MLFGVTVILYFLKILSGSRNYILTCKAYNRLQHVVFLQTIYLS